MTTHDKPPLSFDEYVRPGSRLDKAIKSAHEDDLFETNDIDFQTAELLAKQGHIVYVAARRIEKMEPLEAFGHTPPL